MEQLSPLTLNKVTQPVDRINSILIKMFNEKATYVEMAERIGRTKNAVAGLIRRLREKGLIEAVPMRNEMCIPNTVNEVKVNPPRVVHAKVAPPAEPKIPEVKVRVRLKMIDNETAVTLLELQPHHCRYPIGDPKLSDFRFCGVRRIEKSPYCNEHTLLTNAKREY